VTINPCSASGLQVFGQLNVQHHHPNSGLEELRVCLLRHAPKNERRDESSRNSTHPDGLSGSCYDWAELHEQSLPILNALQGMALSPHALLYCVIVIIVARKAALSPLARFF
jgi:hypothetical protein